jgi:hypothetical protein
MHDGVAVGRTPLPLEQRLLVGRQLHLGDQKRDYANIVHGVKETIRLAAPTSWACSRMGRSTESFPLHLASRPSQAEIGFLYAGASLLVAASAAACARAEPRFLVLVSATLIVSQIALADLVDVVLTGRRLFDSRRVQASRDERSDGARALLPADIPSSAVRLGARGENRSYPLELLPFLYQ